VEMDRQKRVREVTLRCDLTQGWGRSAGIKHAKSAELCYCTGESRDCDSCRTKTNGYVMGMEVAVTVKGGENIYIYLWMYVWGAFRTRSLGVAPG